MLVNENFIEIAEETPDTVITMQNGHRYIVKEKLDDIINLTATARAVVGITEPSASQAD